MAEPVVSLRDVGIRFRFSRRSRHGRHRLFSRKRKPFWGLRHATLDVERGEALGLVGPNGAGKTTLLRTVSGIYEADEGEVEVRGRIGPLLSVTAGLMPRLSGWQNISLLATLLGLPSSRMGELGERIAEFSGLGEFLDAEVRTYSAGMRARLGFSVATFVEPDVLVLDEVLAVGDEEFRRKSAGVIRDFLDSGRTVMVASHELDRLEEMCTRIIWMDHGSIREAGEPAAILERYREARAAAPPEPERPGGRGRRAAPGL
ncbi:MAG: ABC transporter ATP-binding protein [Actinobacteria bacterium]|nr:ABC transporter ATP-binding protein [Actinomycetota bacterium]